MAIRTNTRNLLDNPPIPVQAKLATAWTTGSRQSRQLNPDTSRDFAGALDD